MYLPGVYPLPIELVSLFIFSCSTSSPSCSLDHRPLRLLPQESTNGCRQPSYLHRYKSGIFGCVFPASIWNGPLNRDSAFYWPGGIHCSWLRTFWQFPLAFRFLPPCTTLVKVVRSWQRRCSPCLLIALWGRIVSSPSSTNSSVRGPATMACWERRRPKRQHQIPLLRLPESRHSSSYNNLLQGWNGIYWGWAPSLEHIQHEWSPATHKMGLSSLLLVRQCSHSCGLETFSGTLDVQPGVGAVAR